MIHKIKLTKGKFSIVDEDVYELVSHLKWQARKSGNTWYAIRAWWQDGRCVDLRLHHVIAGFPLKGKIIDHIDCDGLNNRRSNLRIISRRKNALNSFDRKHHLTSSKYVGVYLHRQTRKWASKVRIGGDIKFLGLFTNEIDAANAYRDEFKKLVGEDLDDLQ